jgi:hypothetical protein
MKIELLFALSALLVAPFWLLMIGMPGLALTRAVLTSPWILLPLPSLFTVLLIANGRLWLELIERPTFIGLALILSEPAGALIAWVHILALDLFVGRWIYLDSRERAIPSLAVIPFLWLAMLAGPLGLLLYLIIRPLARPRAPADEMDNTAPNLATGPASLSRPATPGPGPKSL